MKRFVLTPLVFIAAMTSCKKDAPLSEAIIGKWNVVSVSQVTYKNDVKKSETTYYLGDNEMAIQFAEGGTGIFYQNNDVYGMFSWTLSGSTITIPSDPTDEKWDISIDHETLLWTYSTTEITDSANYKYDYFYTAKKSN